MCCSVGAVGFGKQVFGLEFGDWGLEIRIASLGFRAQVCWFRV